ncbi:facilitated trehalose transporter Tret1 [Nomia melanderi]|uniref:facilitated trehalose transporter Tret1 n=1 Tax=Nomia melanderi TaxID=2448451 RepID=UPI0013044DB7|nr:facilitated trehalose transporter Tret1-like [Nomia melanderi]XP_031848081.1 facilitated trehalose transporter Tret1-like [Nomia melanderi]XP_031848165.1 facilitated trehalose transporter Tret1-like [Nomia melanderi]XP_031848252.1 facilitated trehalose transporter Tret1-like [Nomia melanderi]XP_031848334.1 facilitated trehalose transporter Tret1-like [Nomia melanderi]XP_031848426.1 facilitated trehalose transporter Tret1-like [Nomia melanderi]XP_031848501.1 facilitated trehalose transporte
MEKIKSIDREPSVNIPSKEEKGVIYPQLIASFIISLALFTAGLCYSWSAISFLHFEKYFPGISITEEQRSWVVSALLIGSCFGAITPSLLADYIGRKWFLILTCIPPIVSWALVYIAKNWTLLLVARLISGLLIGALFTVVPQYISEIVEPRIRGASSVMMGLLLNLGYITMYGIGPLVSGKILALICLVPSAILLLLFPWLPESPYYYLKKNKEKDAEISLIWLRRSRDNKETLEKMNEFTEMEKGGSMKILFTDKVHRQSFLLALLLLAGQQCSGTIAVQSYIGIIVDQIHFPLDTNMILIILGVINLVAGLAATFTIDRIGRKPLFLISAYIAALSVGVLGTYFLLQEKKFNTKSYAIVPIVAVVVFNTATSFGLVPIPAVVSSEIFPMNIKIWAGSVLNTFGAILSVIVSKTFEPIVTAWGLKTIFYIFALIEVIIATIAVFKMPETSRKTFAEIQHMLQGSNKTEEKQNEPKEVA